MRKIFFKVFQGNVVSIARMMFTIKRDFATENVWRMKRNLSIIKN